MTRAEEIVAIQADLLDEFRTPDSAERGVQLGVQMRAGGEFVVPASKLGALVDTVFYGQNEQFEQAKTRTGGGHYARAIASVAPLVAYGLAEGRTYRIQENMTPAIMARADALSSRTLFSLDGDIMPPRLAGFAWFEELVPYGLDGEDPTDLGLWGGVAAISWATVAGEITHGNPTEVTWLVTVWCDLQRPPWLHLGAPEDAVPGCRFAPMVVLPVRPGDRLPGCRFEPMGGTPIRNPMHIVAALWQMLNETVPSTEHAVDQSAEPIERWARRRARRAGMDDRSEVTTVVLRRQHRPVLHPGTGQPHDSRVWIEPYKARRWVGSGPHQRLVWRTIAGHWSCNDESLPVRHRTIVSELRR